MTNDLRKYSELSLILAATQHALELATRYLKFSGSGESPGAEQYCAPSPSTTYFSVGEPYLIHTVDKFYLGRVVSQSDRFVVLNSCTWIAEEPRLCDFYKTGEPVESEPFPKDLEVSVSLGFIVDYTKWPHSIEVGQR